MRVGCVADLHIDLNAQALGREALLPALAALARSRRLDRLVVAGDLSNHYRTTLRLLARLEQESGVPCLFVPGNHDLWREGGQEGESAAAATGAGGSAWTAWDSYRALSSFPGSLCRGPVELPGGWVAVGDAGWYDYAFGDQRYGTAEFDRMRFEGRLWEDKVRAVWDRSTREMHRWFLERLERQLRRHSGARVLLVTHVVPHRSFTVRPANRLWSYLNAFLGSPEYGQLALRRGVPYHVFGHVHYRRRLTVEGTTFVCCCLGYASEWRSPPDPERELAESLQVIELD